MNTIKTYSITFTIELPHHYRAQEILAFHARDPLQLAERITENSISKAIIIGGHPTLIGVELRLNEAHCIVQTGNKKLSLAQAQDMVRGMLGLVIPVESFERKMRKNPLFAALANRQKGLRIPQAATPFEALTWAIIGQQINLRFAIQLRHAFIKMAGVAHPIGLVCYPDADAVALLDVDQLCTQKFSRAKAETIIRVANSIADGTLPLDQWQQSEANIDEIEAALLAIKGIGPWTAHYTLMRGFGYADCSLHGDAAVRNALAKLNEGGIAPTIKEAEAMLSQFAPCRSLAAAHLWASLKVSA